ncbi:NADPH oxidase 5 [Hondaea fermentalgiana]|uniref:NADPH oxidase 5 n=1 Tax=Hondaea fermentalgiana TaxID=2315210 RepID=A0A2R5GVP2_9STRA|nr:NADPH oxidase 5 [Hondaea fermentalgiana]|eukprot:GBG31984.1 NADPH oxidase 5 [Hondaea fermentalgiana]
MIPTSSPPPKPIKPAHLTHRQTQLAESEPPRAPVQNLHQQQQVQSPCQSPVITPLQVNTAKQTPPAPPPGADVLTFTLWAHNLGYAAGLSNIAFGFVAVTWSQEIIDRPAAGDVLFAANFCGPYCVAIGILLLAWEKVNGLRQCSWLPGEQVNAGRSWLRGAAYIVLAVGTMFSYPTMLAGGVMIICAAANFAATHRNETLTPQNVVHESFLLCKCENKAAVHQDDEEGRARSKSIGERISTVWSRLIEIGAAGQVVFVTIYVLINVVLWVQRLAEWVDLVDEAQKACSTASPFLCLSDYAPFAKAFGQTLNFNCSVILLPVLRTLVRRLNNFSVNGSSTVAKYMPPLRKNIVLHKFIAIFVLAGSIGHIVFHMLNLWKAPEATTNIFQPGAFITGFLITFAMYVIFAGAQNRVKRAQYETFWNTHHAFLLFFACLLAHAPKFWLWGCIPLLAYTAERFYRERKGRKAFYVSSVIFKDPVMCISFFPGRPGDFVFKEGQYLHLLAPSISTFAWHPFTISSAYEDLEKKNGEVTLHIRVQAEGSWTHQLCQRFRSMAGSPNASNGKDFSLYLSHLDSQGVQQRGKHLGPDGLPLIQVDGPHAAPAQHYFEYDEVMLVGAGIGLTPSSAIIQSVLRHKWKKGFNPSTIHFFFVVRHSEIFSFRWFIALLHELQGNVASDYAAGALDRAHNRLQIHLFVTRAPRDGKRVERQKSVRLSGASPRSATRTADDTANAGLATRQAGMNVDLGFTAADLELALLNPSVSSKQMPSALPPLDATHEASSAANQYQNIWIWNGRPNWDEIFAYVKQNRQRNVDRIGVCFCGTPIIGKDLKQFCHKYSSLQDNCRFELHKENF